MRPHLMRLAAALFAGAAAFVAIEASPAFDRPEDYVAAPGWVLPGAALDLDFANGRYWQTGAACRGATSCVTMTRASPETSLLPNSASGASYLTFASGVAAIAPGGGLQVYESRTNYLLNSTAPATQTTASLNAGVYTLWVNGADGATSSAGTATGSGFGVATNGSPNIFTLSGAGTVTVTVSGSLNAFQLENGNGGSPLIVTAGATVTRSADFITVKNALAFTQTLTAFVSGVPTMPLNYGTTQTPLQIDEGDNNQRIDIDRNSSNGIIGTGLFVGGSAQPTPPQSVVWPTGGFLANAYALAVNDEAVVNHGTLATTTGNMLFTPSRIVIGANGNGIHQWDGTISRLAIWPASRQPNSFLAEIAR